MPSEIVHRLSPEEQELAQRREELANLQAELADRELHFANIRANLAAFEGRYLREVGALYAELDDWHARIAELAAQASGTGDARKAATEARAQAEESHSATHGDAAKAAEYSPSPEIDKLYKEVAKQIHPDLTDDQADRALRTRLMAGGLQTMLHVPYFGGISLGSELSEQACVTVAKACAIFPLSIHFYDFGCILTQAGKLDEAKVAFKLFLGKVDVDKTDLTAQAGLSRET